MKGAAGLARWVGLRHLTERRLRSALTVGGVAAGVALLFSITTMNAVLLDAVRSTATAFDASADLQVTAATPGGLPALTATEIKRLDGVAQVRPLVEVRSTMRHDSADQGVFVLGAADAGGLVLSDSLARRLGVKVGDVIDVDAPSGPVPRTVSVITSLLELDRVNEGMVAVLPLSDAQAVFDRAGRLDLVLVTATPGTDLHRLATAIAAKTGAAGVVSGSGATPGASNANVDPFVLLTDAVGLISLFVALILVLNTMSMAMSERRAELSLARAFGASPRQVFTAVIGEAIVIGVTGALVGLAAGALLAKTLLGHAAHAYRSVLPIDAPTGLTFGLGPLAIAAGGGIAVAILGSVLPARRAMRTPAIDSLRPVASYEWSAPSDTRRSALIAAVGATLLAASIALAGRQTSATPSAGVGAFFVVTVFGGITLLLPTAVPLAARGIAALFTRACGVVGRLAGDALRTNPRRTSLTVGTLLLPLAMVIALGTAFGSAEARFGQLAQRFVSTPLVVNADSFVGYTATLPLPESGIATVAAVPGVRAVLPEQNTFITVEDEQAILYVTPISAAQRAGVPDALHDGELAADPDAFRDGLMAGKVAISRLAAHRKGLQPGDTLVLPTPAGGHSFTIVTVFDDLAGEATYYIDRDTYVALWGDTGAFRYAVVPEPGARVSDVQAAIQQAVHDAHLPAQVQTRAQAVRELRSGLTQIFSIARSTQLAALLVAACSLASTAFTVVLERRWALGLQRTLGLSQRQLARSLVMEALSIGVLGVLGAITVGLTLGVLLCQAFGAQVASPLAVIIPWAVLALSAFAGLAIAAAATHHPRRLATRLTIIEALRVEH
ncbi:MAG: ABC transporter permease [Acidimicrobiales bacterium]